MDMKITLEQVITSLEENGQPYGILTLQNAVQLVIVRRGAHILGPFLSPDDNSIFWLNRALAEPAQFKAFLDSNDWNLGGERNWIGPEIQYLVANRQDFWGSVHIPEQLDPGQYDLEQRTPDQFWLSQAVTLNAFNLATGHKRLRLETIIQPVDDPLRSLSNYQTLIDGVTFAGYQQIVSLVENETDDIVSEVWNLIQLNPGGQLIIPSTPHAEHSDYFEPIDDRYLSLESNHIRLKITGDRRYKVGFKAPHVFGRLAYFNHLDDGRACLIVRNFFNNPAAIYAEEPAHTPGRRGHSIQIYNDGGMFGGFGELECNGQTIGGTTGRSSSTDQFVLWLYVGAPDKVVRLLSHLIGAQLEPSGLGVPSSLV